MISWLLAMTEAGDLVHNPKRVKGCNQGTYNRFLVPFWVMCLFSFRDLRFSREKQTTEAVLDSQGKCVLGQEGCSPSDSCLPSSGAKSVIKGHQDSQD